MLFGALVATVGWALSGPRYHGKVSDHFDGRRFHNRRDVPAEGFSGFLRWQLHRHRQPWQRRSLPPGPRPPERVGPGQMRVTFINHATALLQQDRLNVLTDPIWSERASPFSFVGPRRFVDPGLRFEDLPPIDVVLISHNHYDHLDLPTLARLAAKHAPRIFVGLGNGQLLRDAGIGRVTELDWWQSVALVPGVELVAVPTQHFSGRGLFDGDRTLWTGYALRSEAGLSYIAGDTGAGPHFAEIRQRLGPPRLALLPIGAFRPTWFMGRVHVSPQQALAARDTLAAGTTVAIHFGTFALADDDQDEPATALTQALAARGWGAPRFWILGFGEGRDVPPLTP